MEDYSDIKEKTKNKKKYCEANKENQRKRSREYYRSLPGEEKVKKRNYANIRTMMQIDKEKKKI